MAAAVAWEAAEWAAVPGNVQQKFSHLGGPEKTSEVAFFAQMVKKSKRS